MNEDEKLDEDICRRPTLLVNDTQESGEDESTHQTRLDSEVKYPIDEKLRDQLRSTRMRQQLSKQGKAKKTSKDGKLKDETTTEFNFTFNKHNNPVNEIVPR